MTLAALPRWRIIVNLAPDSVHKEGSAYDLPIALGVMTVMNIQLHTWRKCYTIDC